MLVVYAAVVGVLVLGPQVLAKRATATPTTCTGTLANASTNDVIVPDGAVCRITASTVNGDVTVKRDAYFEASGAAIHGNVRATAALTVFIHGGTSVSGSVLVDSAAQLFVYKSTVSGTVKVTEAVAPGFGHVQVCDTTAGRIEVRGSGPDVLIGDPLGGCPGNQVKKDVFIVGNRTMSELQVSGNAITGSLIVTDNTGTSPKHVLNNEVRGAIHIADNADPFESAGNH
jgi:hypothetical protein